VSGLRRAARGLGRALSLLTATATPLAAQQPSAPPPPLQAAAEAIVGRANEADWSAFAWSIDRQQPLFAIHADDVRLPASNNKVFTSLWALGVLGPEHRFDTDVLVSALPGADGVLRGDVYLRGSGDPTFGYPDFEQDPMRPLRLIAAHLAKLGVREVTGAVIGDASIFDSVLVGPDWPKDTGGGSARYAPRVSGLAFQRNLLWVGAEAVPGGGVAVQRWPAVTEIPVVSRARVGGGRAWAVRPPDGDTIEIRGAVSGRGADRYPVGVSHPALLAAGALRAALAEHGIAVGEPARIGKTPAGATLVYRHVSPPLSVMIPMLNRHSDNFFAEHLFKATAATVLGEGSYARAGSASAMFFIRNAGVPYGQLYQADGSGLSSHNRASANALVRALIYAHQAPWAEVFYNSLAIAGDRDGTMRRMFVGTPAAGRIHAKTGYIRGVRTLSGYVTARNGETIAFSFLYNGRNTSGARAVETELGNLLAGYGGAGAAPTTAAR
jgi:D-alanyl-D-alanine carboxypeptidase/D-alanyl-D-alanine-endopeptidase (penicillin-binding protein 4)